MKEKYEDIIGLPRPVSDRYVAMRRQDRAAQFAPFAALSGYDAAIAETARVTDTAAEPDESVVQALDARLQRLQQIQKEQPRVTVCFFRPDERKAGGAYTRVTGRVKKVDAYAEVLVLTDGDRIPFGWICGIQDPEEP